MLLAMLIVMAASSILAPRLPIGVFAATILVSTAGALAFAPSDNSHDYILALIALTTGDYFALRTPRLYSTGADGAPIGELETSRAVSDEARRRAESANVAKSRLLASRSHGLPMRSMSSRASSGSGESSRRTPTYKNYAGDLHNGGAHRLGLSNEILILLPERVMAVAALGPIAERALSVQRRRAPEADGAPVRKPPERWRMMMLKIGI